MASNPPPEELNARKRTLRIMKLYEKCVVNLINFFFRPDPEVPVQLHDTLRILRVLPLDDEDLGYSSSNSEFSSPSVYESD